MPKISHTVENVNNNIANNFQLRGQTIFQRISAVRFDYTLMKIYYIIRISFHVLLVNFTVKKETMQSKRNVLEVQII